MKKLLLLSVPTAQHSWESEGQIWHISPQTSDWKGYFNTLPVHEIITHVSIYQLLWVPAVQHLHRRHLLVLPTAVAVALWLGAASPKAALTNLSKPCPPGLAWEQEDSRQAQKPITIRTVWLKHQNLSWNAISPAPSIAAPSPVSALHNSSFHPTVVHFAFIFCTFLVPFMYT